MLFPMAPPPPTNAMVAFVVIFLRSFSGQSRSRRFPRFLSCHYLATEIGFVCHVTGGSRIVAEHHVFLHRLARANTVEEVLHVRLQIVVAVATENGALGHAQLG